MCDTLTNLVRRKECMVELPSSNLFYFSLYSASALPARPLPVVSGKPHEAITYKLKLF